MIISSLLDSVLNDEKKEDVTISVPKEDFQKFTHDYVPDDLSYPSEEDMKNAFLEITKSSEVKSENYYFDHLKSASQKVSDLEFTMGECYTLKNNEFDYICDCPKRETFLEGQDFGIKELEAAFYYTNYLNGHVPVTRDAMIKHDYPFSNELKKGVVECKQFVARATLYKEAFEKLGEKEAYDFCETNLNKAKKIMPLAMFMAKLWDKTLEEVDFLREHYL